MINAELLESLCVQAWAIFDHGGDRDLGAAVAAQIHEAAARLPVPIARLGAR
jgi:hypothetical protein